MRSGAYAAAVRDGRSRGRSTPSEWSGFGTPAAMRRGPTRAGRKGPDRTGADDGVPARRPCEPGACPKGGRLLGGAATIFVNPTQFGPGEDFEKYPRDEAGDLAALDAAGVDAVYLPGVRDMYPEGHQTFVEVTGVSQGLCGAVRPGTLPRGRDGGGEAVPRGEAPRGGLRGEGLPAVGGDPPMNRDLDFGIEIVGAPIVREEDGLAKSSRNVYLKGDDRVAAGACRGALPAKALFDAGERDAATPCRCGPGGDRRGALGGNWNTRRAGPGHARSAFGAGRLRHDPGGRRRSGRQG